MYIIISYSRTTTRNAPGEYGKCNVTGFRLWCYQPSLLTVCIHFLSTMEFVNPDIGKLTRACHFAAVKHRTQKRKNKAKDPYINHPLEVMDILAKHGINDIDTLCGAVLHDTVEDTGTTPAELIELFGQEVCTIVLECSDDKSLGKVDRKKNQIEHAKHISDKGKLVKLADKFSNINSMLTDAPEKWTPDEKIGYVRWGYRVCEGIFGVPGGEALDRSVREMFANFNVSSVTEEELEFYYSLIAHKE
jgi:guanosine-3',5'-bis(diphosphate) 3'-pyrophosphohydrolase